MIVTRKVYETEELPNPHNVSARKLYDEEAAQVVHLRLAPGQKLRKHITPVDVCFFILEGRGAVEIGDEVVEVEPDTLVESPAGIPHRLENRGETDFRFLVVKTPRPTSETKLL
jgi:mannose-6-phosphate isomerase-like protein (cupin superfamily)